jgi:hypothetical protein
MSKHICQGTKCHTYDTQSRIRGTKGNKVLRTRYAYGDSQSWNINNWCLYFCDERCMQDWLREHIANFMNIVGIKTKPQESPIDIELTTHKAWNGQDYTRTTIKLKENESSVLT